MSPQKNAILFIIGQNQDTLFSKNILHSKVTLQFYLVVISERSIKNSVLINLTLKILKNMQFL